MKVILLKELRGKGGEGGVELAKEVIRLCEQPNDFTFSYELNCSIKEKIEAIAKKIYHADGVNFTANAEKQIKTLTELGYDHMPICMAKTQYSFTDDQTKLGAPRDFTITVRNGAGITGAAAQMSEQLQADGFNVVDVGNTDSPAYSETLIIYKDSAFEPAAQAVLQSLTNGRVVNGGDYYTFDSDILVVLGSDWKPLA